MSALRADARAYCRLRFPGRPVALALPIVWLTSPGLWRLAMHRFSRWAALRRQAQGRTPLNFVLLVLMFPLARLAIMVTKVDTSDASDVDGGVYLSDRGHIVFGTRHTGTGTIVHHEVTIGMRPPGSECPEIGENVWIGPGCIVTGEISIGAGCTLLPGSVVSRDVPPGCLVQGNPARIVQRNFDNTALRSTLRWDIDAKDVTGERAMAS
jgi:serine O-acetyltransferase